MKVLILGASGKTGGLVAAHALAEKHEVTVLVRNASRFTLPGVRVLVGDATVAGDLRKAVQGQDAIIDTIGGTTPYKEQHLERTVARNTIAAMHEARVRKFIVVSMMGIGDSAAQAPFWYRYLLMPTFLRGSTQDKIAMEAEVTASGLDYVIARPPILKDDPPTNRVITLSGSTKGHQITRADLANFLVDQLDSDQHLRQAVTVVNS